MQIFIIYAFNVAILCALYYMHRCYKKKFRKVRILLALNNQHIYEVRKQLQKGSDSGLWKKL